MSAWTLQKQKRTEIMRVRLTPGERDVVRWIAGARQASEGSVLRWALHKALQLEQFNANGGAKDSEAQRAAVRT